MHKLNKSLTEINRLLEKGDKYWEPKIDKLSTKEIIKLNNVIDTIKKDKSSLKDFCNEKNFDKSEITQGELMKRVYMDLFPEYLN